MTARGVLFLEQLRARSYESEYPISVSAGVLRAEGYEARRARVRVPERTVDRLSPPAVKARLEALLRAHPPSHVLIVRDHYRDLESVVRGALPDADVLTVQVREFPALPALRRWLDGGGRPRSLPLAEFLRHEVDEIAVRIQEDPSRLVLECDDLSPEVLAEGFDGDLYLDQHCYYRAPYVEQRYPALQGTAACSFCDIPQFARRSVPTDPGLLVGQLGRYARERPAAKTFHLFDAGVVGHIDQVAEVLARVAPGPVELCIDIRVPEIIRGRERIEEALRRLDGTGHVLDFYCVGFETFSAHELSRFNKGYPVVENVECLLLFAELSARHPGTFEYQRHSSHGFINFTPWSTLDDLLTNAYFARALGFSSATAEWYLRKLRIYDTLPIARLAEADEAFVESYDDARLDNARWKLYRDERPWRFLHESTAAVARWTYRILMPESDAERAVTDRLRAMLEARAGAEWGTLAFAAIVHAVEQTSDVAEPAAAFLARVEALASSAEVDLLPARRVLLGAAGVSPRSDLAAEVDALDVRLVQAGQKPAAKLEPETEAIALAWEARLCALGLAVVRVERQRETNLARGAVGARDDVRALAVARDRAPAQALADAMNSAPHEEDERGVAAIGDALGYPPCCVRAYLERRRAAAVDTRLLALALAATRGAPDPFLDPWSPWRAIEYLPCSFSCEVSRDRARRAREAGLVADDPRRERPQLIVSALSRLILDGAEPVPGGFSYRGVERVGADEVACHRYADALGDGDSVSFTPHLALVHKGSRLVHALPHDVLVPWDPSGAERFAWLADILARVRNGAARADAPATGASPEIVWPPSPSAELAVLFRDAVRVSGAPLDEHGRGHVMLLGDGEHAFFSGSVEPVRGGVRVRITRLLQHRLPKGSRNAAVHAVLQPGARFVLREPRLGTELHVVVFGAKARGDRASALGSR